MRALSGRLLSVLQLTRMALVFTAIADSECELMLGWSQRAGAAPWPPLRWVGAIAMMSVGLYGFGMSLNDIIDRRRDAQIAAGRPLPSGRIGLVTAHVICVLLALAALAGAAYYGRVSAEFRHGLLSLALAIGTGLLIAFYDFAGTYLVGLGLISLGLVRFCHCLVPSPEVPLVWHPLFLLNHVTILSTVAYVWEEKRPPLTKLHWWGVMGGLALFDAAALTVIAWRRYEGSVAAALRWDARLLLPLGAMLTFVVLGARLYRRSAVQRAAGQKLMLYGLLWLIVYDALFAAAYVRPLAGVLLALLLPIAYGAVLLMRWWSKVMPLGSTPQYARAARVDVKREAQ
jgi:4-hydroxybenzoate polyprenyltransferase